MAYVFRGTVMLKCQQDLFDTKMTVGLRDWVMIVLHIVQNVYLILFLNKMTNLTN